MTTKDLIPLGQPGNEERDKAVRAKLKGSSSDKRKLAQRKLGVMKAKPENRDAKILALITDPLMYATDLIEFIKKIEKMDMNASTHIMLANAKTNAMRQIFGTKSINVNLNKDISSAESMHTIYLEVLNESDGKTNTKGSNKKQKR